MIRIAINNHLLNDTTHIYRTSGTLSNSYFFIGGNEVNADKYKIVVHQFITTPFTLTSVIKSYIKIKLNMSQLDTFRSNSKGGNSNDDILLYVPLHYEETETGIFSLHASYQNDNLECGVITSQNIRNGFYLNVQLMDAENNSLTFTNISDKEGYVLIFYLIPI